jgi:hypothetical protein
VQGSFQRLWCAPARQVPVVDGEASSLDVVGWLDCRDNGEAFVVLGDPDRKRHVPTVCNAAELQLYCSAATQVGAMGSCFFVVGWWGAGPQQEAELAAPGDKCSGASVNPPPGSAAGSLWCESKLCQSDGDARSSSPLHTRPAHELVSSDAASETGLPRGVSYPRVCVSVCVCCDPAVTCRATVRRGL